MKRKGIAEVVKKTKGMNTNFHQSLKRPGRLVDPQVQFNVLEEKPAQIGNSLQWHYTHDSMNWFCEEKMIVQNYGLNFGDAA